MKIWAKVMLNDKIVKDYLLETVDKFDKDNFLDYLIRICEALDIPTPVLTKTSINHFENFNITRFKTADFVEQIYFDQLVLEWARTKDEKKNSPVFEFPPRD